MYPHKWQKQKTKKNTCNMEHIFLQTVDKILQFFTIVKNKVAVFQKV